MAAALVCPLWLRDCHIVQPINLNEATAPSIRLPGCRVFILAADGLRTTGDLVLDEQFTARGEILLRGARIGGSLSLSRSKIASLSADRLMVDGGMSFQGASVRGEVRLLGARVGGQLAFRGAHLVNPGGIALAADGLSVGSNLICDERFTVNGEIGLDGAHVGGDLVFSGACLANPGGTALAGQRIIVDDSLFCDGGFTAIGQIDLLGAQVSNQVILNGATLTNPRGWALSADGLVVGENMTGEEGFRADGGIRLIGARIGSQLNLNGAFLANPRGRALLADMLVVDRSMSCAEGFTAHGQIRLVAARIGGELSLTGASLNNPGGTALSLERAQIADLFLLPANSPDGIVNLGNAKVGSFHDAAASWPAVLDLRGFAYDRLENTDVSVAQRLEWLRRNQGGYTPQIYDQLAAAYRHAGDRSASRKIEVAKQRRCRSPLNPLNWLWFLTVGYGYRTWWAGIWLAALVAVGTIVFGRAYPGHMIAVRAHPPAFHAVGYALDTLLPIVDLGEKSAWQPEGTALYWSWAMILAGWTLTTAVVAGLTGVLKRD